MHRHNVTFKGRLARVTLAASAAPIVAASTPAVPPPPVVEPLPPAVPPVEVAALRTMLAELGRLAEKLRTQQRDAAADVAQTAVELAVALAERLVNAEIGADRQRLDRIVRDTLERMTPAPTVTVRGHPDDLALLQRQMNEHAELQAPGDLLTFRPEKGGSRGQLKIEADEWFVEWDTQRSVAELRDALLEETFADE